MQSVGEFSKKSQEEEGLVMSTESLATHSPPPCRDELQVPRSSTADRATADPATQQNSVCDMDATEALQLYEVQREPLCRASKTLTHRTTDFVNV